LERQAHEIGQLNQHLTRVGAESEREREAANVAAASRLQQQARDVEQLNQQLTRSAAAAAEKEREREAANVAAASRLQQQAHEIEQLNHALCEAAAIAQGHSKKERVERERKGKSTMLVDEMSAHVQDALMCVANLDASWYAHCVWL
jgi:uncharacterized protein (DUF1015 family)